MTTDQSPVAPVQFDQLWTETSDHHDEPWQWNWQVGTQRTVLSTDPHTGGSTYIVRFPPGYERPDHRRRPEATPEQFEWHSCHEEIFCLDGRIQFGDWYDLPELGYLNHPPGWLHPADQYSDVGATLLIKNAAPCDFIFVDIPEDWDGIEAVVDDSRVPPHAANMPGVTTTELFDANWAEIFAADGTNTGALGKCLYTDPNSNWSTWICQVPEGWAGFAKGPGRHESIFVLKGELSVGGGEELMKWGYASTTESRLLTEGTRSDKGATIICWTYDLPSAVTFGKERRLVEP